MREIPISEIQTLVGQEIGVSDWLEITQDRVNRFADATGDHQWIHVDVERATKELGAPIAHGYLVLSPTALVAYKCDNFYAPSHEAGLGYDDPTLAINCETDLAAFIVSVIDNGPP